MMTPAQTRHYWRMWSKAATAAGWKGREPCLDPTRLTDTGRRVLEIAEDLSRRCACPITPEVLRHACHAAAIGHTKSSKKLSNADLDRVLLVFKLVADGDDLAAVIAFDNPEQGSIKRLTWAIRRAAPAPLTVKLCRDKFGRADWENLGAVELQQLLMTVSRVIRKGEARADTAQPG